MLLRRVPVAGLLRFSGTRTGQLVGLALIMLPAVVNALPLDGAAGSALLLVAVVAGFAGVVVVFGALLVRAFPAPADIPHPRAVWTTLLAVAVLLAAGAAACLVAGLGDDEYLPGALMFGLPGLALGYLLWRTSAIFAAPPPAAPVVEPEDEPVDEPVDETAG